MLDFAATPAYDEAPSIERDLAGCVAIRVDPADALFATVVAEAEREGA